jgi:cytochrome oxidase Cu insertion factor (SCO1/SenC/PrrC family)
MKKTLVERRIMAVLFVLVLVVFSFAERDTKKLMKQYHSENTAGSVKKFQDLTASVPEQPSAPQMRSRN